MRSTIDHVLGWMADNEKKYQAEQRTHSQERHPNPVGHCFEHNAPMFYDLRKVAMHLPEEACYTCWTCEKIRHDEEKAQASKKAVNALFPNKGDYVAGLGMIHARASLQEKALRNVLSAVSTAPTSPEQNSEEIDLSAIATSPLPPTKYRHNPATPTPEVREDLFQDVPNDVAAPLIPMDKDRTEIRRKIILPRKLDTQEFPAARAEMLLVEMTRGPVHPQETGEQEPVKNWMC